MMDVGRRGNGPLDPRKPADIAHVCERRGPLERLLTDEEKKNRSIPVIDVEPRPQQDPYDFIPGHRRPAFSIHHLRALLQCGSKTGGRGRGKERKKKKKK